MAPISIDHSTALAISAFIKMVFWGGILYVFISTYINIRKLLDEFRKANELLENINRKLPEKAVVDLGPDEDD